MQNLNQYKTKIREKLPNEIAASLLELENLELPDEQKIAVFDLDNTLINGDIGESVFCYLKSIGHEFDLKWKEYLELIDKKEYQNAYSNIITTMKGLSVKVVSNAARRLITSNSDSIYFSEDGIEYSYPIPKEIPDITHLIVYLKISGWKIAVISASSHISVRAVCETLFKLNPEYVRGVRTEIDVTDNYDDLYTDIIRGELSYGAGKVNVFHEMFGNDAKPLITAGDSLGDIDLMNLSSPNGFAIIRGASSAHRQHLKSKLRSDIKTIEYAL